MKIRSAVHIFFAGTLILAAAGCSAPKITNTPRNAIEQLLVAAVIERGVYGIQLDKYRDKKFFLNYDNLAPQVDKPYLQGCVELHCAASGITVVKEQKEADYLVDVLCGVLATDDSQILLGTPELPIPIPDTSLSVAIPEIALFKVIRRYAVGRFSLNILNAADRKPAEVIRGANARSQFNNWPILLIPFTTQNIELPETNYKEMSVDFFE